MGSSDKEFRELMRGAGAFGVGLGMSVGVCEIGARFGALAFAGTVIVAGALLWGYANFLEE